MNTPGTTEMTASVLGPELDAEIAAVAQEQGCELLEIRHKGDVLQIVLDHPDGVTLEHCEAVSARVSALLDVDDYGTGRYTLEVSSPGLNRPLTRLVDWERARGELVKIQLRAPEENELQTLVGRLEEFDLADGGTATVIDPDGSWSRRIAVGDVKKARLELEY